MSPFKWFYATLYFLAKINENNRCSDKVLVFYIFVTENDKKKGNKIQKHIPQREISFKCYYDENRSFPM